MPLLPRSLLWTRAGAASACDCVKLAAAAIELSKIPTGIGTENQEAGCGMDEGGGFDVQKEVIPLRLPARAPARGSPATGHASIGVKYYRQPQTCKAATSLEIADSD